MTTRKKKKAMYIVKQFTEKESQKTIANKVILQLVSNQKNKN